MLRMFFRGPFLTNSYRIFVRKVHGIENLPKNTGFIVAANHSSYLDVITMSTVLSTKNYNIRYLAKPELFNNWLFKRLQKVYEGIPIDRKLKGKEALKLAISALNEGHVVGIYPEGTRSLDGKLQKGKTGVARLALWAKVPVVPIGITGAFDLMPKGQIIPKFRKNIIINIGKPIYFNRYYNKRVTKKLLRAVTDKIMNKIAGLSLQEYVY